MAKVKFNGSAPGPAPKAVGYAQIDKQGRIPYGSTADVTMPSADIDYSGASKGKKEVARGMGAAKRGGQYTGCT
jgi:hypothetical protein|tara:strand:- start:447 stop:668 length:222 start_codon:yes stop_codon:yes gene_type:complete